jgi:hypothetical protein
MKIDAKVCFQGTIWRQYLKLLLPSGTYVQTFGSIAPAVTKRAVLTDDGRHMIDCIGSPQVSQKSRHYMTLALLPSDTHS